MPRMGCAGAVRSQLWPAPPGGLTFSRTRQADRISRLVLTARGEQDHVGQTLWGKVWSLFFLLSSAGPWPDSSRLGHFLSLGPSFPTCPMSSWASLCRINPGRPRRCLCHLFTHACLLYSSGAHPFSAPSFRSCGTWTISKQAPQLLWESRVRHGVLLRASREGNGTTLCTGLCADRVELSWCRW